MESVSSELVRDQSRSGPSEHNGAARMSIHPESVSTGRLETSIEAATSALLKCQEPDGHWVFECEADSTTPAEYVLLRHYLAEPVDTVREAKIGNYLRRIQGAHGGWPLFHDGDFDMSASVKAYFGLKMIGDSPDAPHMVRARDAIRARGGASRANVFTRILLALFGLIPWRALPLAPVEIMLLPKWFPFHLDKISYWSRCTVTPLVVVQALKPKGRNPKCVNVEELFLEPFEQRGAAPRAPHQNPAWFWLFKAIDFLLHTAEPFLPKRMRKRAIDRAVAWVTERLNGEDGLGAIFPPMANTVMMYDALGYPEDHPHRAIARKAIEKYMVVHEHEAYCQATVSPIWDTMLACHALLEVGGERAQGRARDGLRWLLPHQILDLRGDLSVQRPNVRPGGWAFQYCNAYYPDTDDTAVAAMALHRAGDPEFRTAVARAREWLVGMQSRNGGWGAFDADNTHYWINHIPYADHGAFLDPPTEDMTARTVSLLAQGGLTAESPILKRALDYLRRTQRKDGSWYGRWAVNYINGTWSALCAFNAVGMEHAAPEFRNAVRWLVEIQNPDGGWGEDCRSYKLDYSGYEPAPSTASQTAWALLALMAAGEIDNPAVTRGVAYLVRTQGEDGFWEELRFTFTGFPRVFLMRFHGYSKYFPLWALARYRNLKATNSPRVVWHM
jgi:squalene-hopene/tetraprenyl-beta-curcumene cyclase